MLNELFVHKTSTIRVTSLIVILVELTVGKLYPKSNRKLNIDAVKYLPPIVQQLEVPEVPVEYEDDDKPSKLRIQFELNILELLIMFVAYDNIKMIKTSIT